MLSMWVVVVERREMGPMVLGPFQDEIVARRAKVRVERAAKGHWEEDPDWHNYPREPVQMTSTTRMVEMVSEERMVERLDAKKNRLAIQDG